MYPGLDSSLGLPLTSSRRMDAAAWSEALEIVNRNYLPPDMRSRYRDVLVARGEQLAVIEWEIARRA